MIKTTQTLSGIVGYALNVVRSLATYAGKIDLEVHIAKSNRANVDIAFRVVRISIIWSALPLVLC